MPEETAVTALFIGGPLDGEIRTIVNPLAFYRAYQYAAGSGPNSPLSELNYEIVTYRIHKWAEAGKAYYVYTLEGNKEPILPSLMVGYSQWKQAEKKAGGQ